jgi:hypothetical protein
MVQTKQVLLHTCNFLLNVLKVNAQFAKTCTNIVSLEFIEGFASKLLGSLKLAQILKHRYLTL